MKKRYIVALNATTTEQQNAFREHLETSGLGWWHWLRGLWLVSDPSGSLTAGQVRDTVREFFPGVRCMVFELRDDGDTWAGFGPRTEASNMFDWIKRNWKK